MLYNTRGSSILIINYIQFYGINQSFRGVSKVLKETRTVPLTQTLGTAVPLHSR